MFHAEVEMEARVFSVLVDVVQVIDRKSRCVFDAVPEEWDPVGAENSSGSLTCGFARVAVML
jgi:hypothetical protein